MYSTSLKKKFVTQHVLPNAPGIEKERHSHPYEMEIAVAGNALDENGYLVDLDEIDRTMNELIERYRDRTLNDLPEFEDLNPSLENFARVIWNKFIESIDTSRLVAVRVRLWENENAYASFGESVEK